MIATGTDWGSTVVTGIVALLAAMLGGVFVLVASKQSLRAAAQQAADQRAADRTAVELQYRRQLLSQCAGRLLDALWTKERELCVALDMCRNEAAAGTSVSPDDPALMELSRLDLAVYRDMITSLPFIQDTELRARMRSAAKMVNDCYNIRGGSLPGTPHGGSRAMFERAMIEVQAYFKWLRWNFVCGLQGDPLPTLEVMPEVRRPEGGTMWSCPGYVPPWT